MYGIKPALQTPPQATQGDNYGLDDGAIGEERASPAFVYDGSSTWGVRLVSKNTQSAYERKGGASPQGISLSPRGASPFAGGGPNGLLSNVSPTRSDSVVFFDGGKQQAAPTLNSQGSPRVSKRLGSPDQSTFRRAHRLTAEASPRVSSRKEGKEGKEGKVGSPRVPGHKLSPTGDLTDFVAKGWERVPISGYMGFVPGQSSRNAFGTCWKDQVQHVFV